MTDLSDSFPSPRQLGVMIVNGLYDPEKDNVEECIEELLSFMPEKFPRRTAELQIKAIISNPSQPVKLENRVKPTRENPYPVKEPVDSDNKRKALRFAVNWFGRNDQKYFVRLITDIINSFETPRFTSEEARWIANQALAKYQIATSTVPEFNSAQSLYLKSLKKPSGKIIIQKKNVEEVSKPNVLINNGTETGTVEVGKFPQVSNDPGLKLRARDQIILLLLHENSVGKIAQTLANLNYGISKSAFYRIIKKLEKLGIIHRMPKTFPQAFVINPSFQKSSLIFLSLSQPSVPLFEVSRESSPNDEISEETGSTNSQNTPSPVPLSPNSENSREKPLEFPILSRDSPSNNSPEKENGGFDERILRSHNYFFKIPIQRKPANLDNMLKQANWFERKQMINWHYWKGSLANMGTEGIIQFNPNVISVWLNNIYGRDPHENDLEANRRILKIKAHLEDSYQGLYLAPAKFLRRVENTGKHQAWVHHNLSLKAKQQNVSLKGLNWEVDSSKDQPELEAHNNLEATEHLSEELEDFDYRAEKRTYFRHLHSNQSHVVSSLEQTSENLREVSENQNRLAGGLMTNFQIIEAALRSNVELHQKFKEIESRINEIVNSGPYEVRRTQPEESNDKIKVSLPILQATILRFIQDNPGVSRKTIAEECKLSRGSVNGTIPRLKRKGFIYEHQRKLFFKNKQVKGEIYV